jgi:hypothetical protein
LKQTAWFGVTLDVVKAPEIKPVGTRKGIPNGQRMSIEERKRRQRAYRQTEHAKMVARLNQERWRRKHFGPPKKRGPTKGDIHGKRKCESPCFVLVSVAQKPAENESSWLYEQSTDRSEVRRESAAS